MEKTESEITIRRATERDIYRILEIFDSARRHMRANGNFSQWAGEYPGKADVLKDLSRGSLYVGEDERHGIVMTFAFIQGEDPTYSHIDGNWLNDQPYGTIHRIASDGQCRGVLAQCIRYCLRHTDNIRIDTHKDNAPMLKTLAECSFQHCGVIICSDGTPREAFQLSSHNENGRRTEPRK